MDQVVLAFSKTKITVSAEIMLYKNTKVIVRSPDGDTDREVLTEDTLARFLFLIRVDYVL